MTARLNRFIRARFKSIGHDLNKETASTVSLFVREPIGSTLSIERDANEEIIDGMPDKLTLGSGRV